MSSSLRRRALRGATLGAIVAGTAPAAATPALAHVTAQTTEAQQGGYAVVTMRVPNESDTDARWLGGIGLLLGALGLGLGGGALLRTRRPNREGTLR